MNLFSEILYLAVLLQNMTQKGKFEMEVKSTVLSPIQSSFE